MSSNSSSKLEPAPIMYHLPPVLTGNLKTDPAPIMYHVKSYHEADDDSDMRDVTKKDEGSADDAIQEIERKQLELIEQLQVFLDRLKKSFVKKEPKIADNKGSSHKGKVVPKTVKAPTNREPSGVAFFYTEKSLKVPDVGQSIRACTQPVLADFEEIVCPSNLSLSLNTDDRKWMSSLAKIGTHRGVSFTGSIESHCTAKVRCTISVDYNTVDSKHVEARFNDIVVNGRLPVMKLIGSIIGLYPVSKDHAALATHADRWLNLADEILCGEKSLDYSCRLLSRALSSFDFLASSQVVTVADIVCFSIIAGQNLYPNNVELWLKRVESTIF